ncbi:unnamed protein product [Choristocarpus tenellus]
MALSRDSLEGSPGSIGRLDESNPSSKDESLGSPRVVLFHQEHPSQGQSLRSPSRPEPSSERVVRGTVAGGKISSPVLRTRGTFAPQVIERVRTAAAAAAVASKPATSLMGDEDHEHEARNARSTLGRTSPGIATPKADRRVRYRNNESAVQSSVRRPKSRQKPLRDRERSRQLPSSGRQSARTTTAFNPIGDPILSSKWTAGVSEVKIPSFVEGNKEVAGGRNATLGDKATEANILPSYTDNASTKGALCIPYSKSTFCLRCCVAFKESLNVFLGFSVV